MIRHPSCACIILSAHVLTHTSHLLFQLALGMFPCMYQMKTVGILSLAKQALQHSVQSNRACVCVCVCVCLCLFTR
jgi:hypothetical protein